MSTIPQLLPVEVNSEVIKNTVLTNAVKMLTERKLLLKENQQKNIDKLIATQTDDFIYKIKLDSPINDTDEAAIFIIKIFNQKITAINKSSGIVDFLHEFKNNPKILIVKSINSKAAQHIVSSYPDSEIFTEKDLMINLIDHVSVPKHIPLTKEESEQIVIEYNAKKKSFPKMFDSEPVSRYYNMKSGDICRIIRSSETSCLVPYYRQVIRGHNQSD
jgi:DNA-directed RNA polymerase I, II, and III subunit RPABC1